MKKKNADLLDPNELLMLAVGATRKNEDQRAIGYLEKLLDIAPDNANAWHLLGGLHASQGLYERAIEDMARAVELEPGLHTARFQLGLLHFTSGQIAQAEEAWRPFSALGENHAFHFFHKGMLNLARDEFADCIADLQKGISLNTQNPSLNKDMLKVVQKAREALGH